MMKILYYLGCLALIGLGVASLAFDAQLPFDSHKVIVTISSSAITLDMFVLAAGIILLVLGVLLGNVNN